MKKILTTVLTLFLLTTMYGQDRVLTWSIGEVQVSCDGDTEICYPVMVSIDDESQSPTLGTSTIRFFYDAGYLSDLNITNLQNGYTESGLSESADVFGTVMGFSGGGGVFAQFDLIDNTSDLLDITGGPVHVLDLCFTLDPSANFPLCAPIVFDNNHCSWGNGSNADDGYRDNDAGMVGAFYLDGNTGALIEADDEVTNFLWDENLSFDCRLDDPATDDVGSTATTACIESDCGEPDNCACQDNVIVTLDNDCEFHLEPSNVLSGRCNIADEVVVSDHIINGGQIDGVGRFEYGVFDFDGELICWGHVTAEDKTAPEITAPDDVTLECWLVDLVLNQSSTVAQPGVADDANDKDDLGKPTVDDACEGDVGFTWADVIEYGDCEDEYTAKITRRFTATDSQGNTSTDIQVIVFKEVAASDFAFKSESSSTVSFTGPNANGDWELTVYDCTPDADERPHYR